MFRINWGVGIALFYGCFVVAMLTLVYFATQQKFELVTDDYYEQELVYQDRIDAINNTHELSMPVTVDVQEDGVMIQFPSEFNRTNTDGTALFYCPSDASHDFIVLLNLDKDGKQLISSKLFQKGFYVLKLEWSAEGKKYFAQKDLEF